MSTIGTLVLLAVAASATSDIDVEVHPGVRSVRSGSVEDGVLSEQDLELIDAVQLNPRASWARVGATLEVSAMTAARRWRALADEGVAWTGSTMGPRLFRGAVLDVATRPGSGDDVVARLAAMPEVLTVGRTTGQFDVYGLVVAPTVPALGAVLHGPLASLDAHTVRTHVYTRVYGGPQWRLAILNRTRSAQVRDRPERAGRPSDTDADDRRLFLALAADARRTYADLAHELGSTPQAVRRRLARLQRGGHLALRADMARPMAGWPLLGQLWLEVPDDAVDAVGHELGGWPETRFCAALAARATMLFTVNLRSPEELEDVVVRVRATRPDVVVADRRLVLRLDKVNGHLLDSRGRSRDVVPVDPWAAGERSTEAGTRQHASFPLP